MNKKLRDGLKEVIEMEIDSGMSIVCDSITELMMLWYENCRDNINDKGITYRGHLLDIVYDLVLDDNGEVIEETDFITIRKDLEEQIAYINYKLGD